MQVRLAKKKDPKFKGLVRKFGYCFGIFHVCRVRKPGGNGKVSYMVTLEKKGVPITNEDGSIRAFHWEDLEKRFV
jgi:transposase